MKKSIKTLLVACLMIASVSGTVALAESEEKDGGTWEYGYNIGQAYSRYYHSYNDHGSLVVDRNNGKNRMHDNEYRGAWSDAYISIGWWGGKASFYYSSYGWY